jgi:hypothetical protein
MKKLLLVFLFLSLISCKKEEEKDFMKDMEDTKKSAILYDEASSIDSTDQVLGIDDPGGTWSIKRFNIDGIPVDPDQMDGIDNDLLDINSIHEETKIRDADGTGSFRFAFNTTADRIITVAGDVDRTLPENPLGKSYDHDIWQCYSIDSSALDVDGTGAIAPTSVQVYSSANYPKSYLVEFTDAANESQCKFIAPANWDGASVYVAIYVHSEESSPSGTVEFTVELQPRGTGEAFNTTWTTPVTIQFGSAITTKGVAYAAESAIIAASGAANDLVYIRLIRDHDDGTNDTSTTSIYLHALRMCFQINKMNER